MSNARTRYNVVYDEQADNWRVEKDGATRATAVCATREEAVLRADELARKNKPSQVSAEERGTQTRLKSVYDAVS